MLPWVSLVNYKLLARNNCGITMCHVIIYIRMPSSYILVHLWFWMYTCVYALHTTSGTFEVSHDLTTVKISHSD